MLDCESVINMNPADNSNEYQSDNEKENQKLDNPDQRLTQDVNSLCDSFSTIIPTIIISPFVIGWYGYQVQTTT